MARRTYPVKLLANELEVCVCVCVCVEYTPARGMCGVPASMYGNKYFYLKCVPVPGMCYIE